MIAITVGVERTYFVLFARTIRKVFEFDSAGGASEIFRLDLAQGLALPEEFSFLEKLAANLVLTQGIGKMNFRHGVRACLS